jgi:hypothetical protein
MRTPGGSPWTLVGMFQPVLKGTGDVFVAKLDTSGSKSTKTSCIPNAFVSDFHPFERHKPIGPKRKIRSGDDAWREQMKNTEPDGMRVWRGWCRRRTKGGEDH